VLPIHFTVQRRRVLAVTCACLIAAALALRHHGPSGAAATPLRVAPIVPTPAQRAAAPGSAPSPANRPALPIVVDVAGAVRRPGLYHLSQGARVADAIATAGGLTRKAERSAVNLAARVADGEQVLVATRGSAAATGAVAPGGGPTAPVSLNSASAEELDTLPGVGPVTAQKIIAFREQHGPFTSVEGLDAIPGIGPARIADLRGLVVP
jgi:competence protein ComEA